MTEYCMVFVTLPDMETSRRIADILVSERLCACASLCQGYTSIFIWKNTQEIASETLMIIKTTVAMLQNLESRIKELHPYEVFEFLALPVMYGNQAYLDWVKETVS